MDLASGEGGHQEAPGDVEAAPEHHCSASRARRCRPRSVMGHCCVRCGNPGHMPSRRRIASVPFSLARAGCVKGTAQPQSAERSAG